MRRPAPAARTGTAASPGGAASSMRQRRRWSQHPRWTGGHRGPGPGRVPAYSHPPCLTAPHLSPRVRVRPRTPSCDLAAPAADARSQKPVQRAPPGSQPAQNRTGREGAGRGGCDSTTESGAPSTGTQRPAPRRPHCGQRCRALAAYEEPTGTEPRKQETPRTMKSGAFPVHVECRRRPTLPHPGEYSTIGAGRLSYRVRNGTGRSPTAMTTDNTIQQTPTQTWGDLRTHNPHRVVGSGSHSGCEQLVVASPRPISTGQLHPSQGFHLRPINPVISWEPYPLKGGGRPHLGTGFPLRCLQRLSLPNIANQPCPWRDNWHTRGSSVPVLSY